MADPNLIIAIYKVAENISSLSIVMSLGFFAVVAAIIGAGLGIRR